MLQSWSVGRLGCSEMLWIPKGIQQLTKIQPPPPLPLFKMAAR